MVDRPDCPCAAGHGRNRPQTLKRPQMLSDERVGQSSAGRGSRSLLVRSRRASPYIVNRTLSWAVRTRRTPTDRMGTAAWLEHHVRRLGKHLWKRHGVHTLLPRSLRRSALDRKSVLWGKSVSVRVDLGGGGNIKK